MVVRGWPSIDDDEGMVRVRAREKAGQRQRPGGRAGEGVGERIYSHLDHLGAQSRRAERCFEGVAALGALLSTAWYPCTALGAWIP